MVRKDGLSKSLTVFNQIWRNVMMATHRQCNSLFSGFFVVAFVCALLVGSGLATAASFQYDVRSGDDDGMAEFFPGLEPPTYAWEERDRADAFVGEAGSWRNSARTAALIMYFELPEVGAGQYITDATFSINHIEVIGSPDYGVDLYGLGYSAGAPFIPSTASEVESFFYAGDTADTRAGQNIAEVALIQSDFLDGESPGWIENSAAATVDLVAFLNSLYDAGAEAGDYAILRISSRFLNDGSDADNRAFNDRYTFNHGWDDNDVDDRPLLSITGIPEPSTLVLLGLGGLLLMKRRRL